MPGSADVSFVRRWLAQWFRVWLEAMETPQRLFEATYCYVVLMRMPLVDDVPGAVEALGPVVEAGCGSDPRAPEDWQPLALERIVREVVRFLE